MNKVELTGWITKDMTLKKTPDDVSILSFTLSVPRNDRNKTKDFIKCVAWRSVADLMNQYLHTGSHISIVGRITVHNWEDKNGAMQWKTEVTVDEVEFLDPKPKDGFTPVNDDLPF